MICQFSAVTLWVENFESAIHFYQDVLGLELLTRPGEMPQFRVGDGLLVLAKGKFHPSSDAFPRDFPQVAFRVGDLNAIAARLQDLGVVLDTNIQERRDACWIRLRDPDGNHIQFVEIRPD